MRAKKQRPIFFSNTCGCIVDYSELEKAILWYQLFPTHSKKKIYLHGKYPCVTIGDTKIHVHRLLMLFWNKSKVMNQYCHHVNHNKLDCSRYNLISIDVSKHQSCHNLGKIISNEHRVKISIAGKNRKGIPHPRRTDISNSVIQASILMGHSISKISKDNNWPWSTIKSRIIKNNLHDKK